ncbi:hypothetical protein EZS27_004515 [termite gut metagenome]|uniref:Uncharacterized protein n=1 Tax=termite gut metagenome TaxID=433724 RepID=A0A5J4SRW3_9ZZZZ
MKKAVYKMSVDAGRNGTLYGLFVAEKAFVNYMIENKVEVYFGEVLGKHSEIQGSLGPSDIKMVSDDPEFVKAIQDKKAECGYNPLEQATYEWEDGQEGTVGEYINYKLNGIKPE